MPSRSFAIVPAAGLSLRMGTPKLLLPWRDKAVVEHTIEAWHAGGVDRVLVVVRADDAALAERVANCGAEVVGADPPPADMKASVKIGLARVSDRYQPCADDAWLTAPADLPSLSPIAIRRLLAAHHPAAPAVLVAAHQARPGHPVLFPWSYAGQIDTLAADEGLRQLIQRAAPRWIECGEGAVGADLDTPADYERLQNETPPRPE
ncbi:MAG TPA: nucleotidyltransferase family protein [Pirellulales bacterium]|nr:nucleotidyltransferase family protein [Pirellulales bacterium]